MNLLPILYPKRATWRRRFLIGLGEVMQRPWDFGLLLSFGVAAVGAVLTVVSLCF